jgi:hypothetical protein
LRDYKRQYRYYRRMNKIAKAEAEHRGQPEPERKTVKKSRGCLMGSEKYDAENYYCEKVRALCIRIKEETKKQE